MTKEEAVKVLKEMNRWRRYEGEYSSSNIDAARCVPYTPEEFGEAIDVAVEVMSGEK